MSYDSSAHLAHELEGQITEFQEAVRLLKQGGDRQEKDMLKKRVREKAQPLLGRGLPHLVYHELCWQDKEIADEFRSQWAKSALDLVLPNGCAEEIWKVIACQEIDIAKLPKYSAVIRFSVTLDKPYLSRDENLFYIIDNPVRREKVFGRPYVASSSWKGSLRSALRSLGNSQYLDSGEIARRLFGNERGVEAQEITRSGRLFIYPTFFNKVELEVINPHDRATRAGRRPILMECVPAGAGGIFTLIYVPFDRAGTKGKEADAETARQVEQDLQAAAAALKEMLTVLGFGAKVSSGYGLARNRDLNGTVTANVEVELTEVQPPKSMEQQSLPRYLESLGRLIAKFRDEDEALLELSVDEIARLSKSDRLLYEKAKKWWEREGKAAHEKHTDEGGSSHTTQPNEDIKPKYFSREFTTFDDLIKTVSDLAEVMKKGAKDHGR
ncbi:MAG: RAMP superfamily CRISPR-associated protein [Firmicutes bacterium]|nr:RAMP superfamily CRISPR-associated protein [Bacillota bacterium]